MKKLLLICICLCFVLKVPAQSLEQRWLSPSDESRSWVFWYWIRGAVSKEGITADLEAMKANGIAGAHLTPVKAIPEKPLIEPIVEQLSPLWWEMVDFAFKEADRVGVKIAFHICDGFALAGGPWITPELSMQKVVWSELNLQGGKTFNDTLPTPENYKGYYEDIAVFAFPSPEGEGVSTETVVPKVTSGISGVDAQFLANKEADGTFRSENPCWIQYEFETPFVCRSIQVEPAGESFQAQRLTIEASDDGVNFRKIVQLAHPRQGWQDTEHSITHSIPPTKARYFRFLYDREGTEPGSEDVNSAKWKQSLKIKGIYLSSEAKIHQYEGKNGEVWRVSPRTTTEQIPDELCVNPDQIVDVSRFMDAKGKLQWKIPEGKWTILRVGHTSTGHMNETAGKAIGLECDKFNPEAIRLQLNSWFGKAYEVADPERASRVLKLLYLDSWECSSQNWSPVFREEFTKRRGYDLYNYLPVMAGIPVKNVDISERFLYDVRQTISELVVDRFYGTLKEEVHAKGCELSAENVAPTMVSDGMMHYKHVDIPMGEFWLKSPTHDKMNDMLDAISGAHVYGKNIVQAEAFTQLRTMFTEHPGMLKTLQDREYALGFTRMSYHVYALNPWLDRKPGMTLDGIGLLFQRDQTWWKPGRAWVDYAQRCQALLQYGKPVVDLAVFTGEEVPRRSILPDRLVPFLPGIFGQERVEEEKARLANVGNPLFEMPLGVYHSANMFYTEKWINSLRGYAYDSFNPDVLRSVKVENGRIVLPGGAVYYTLIIPGKHPMQPNPERMSLQTAEKLFQLVKDGATLMVDCIPEHTPGLTDFQNEDAELRKITGNHSLFQTSAQTVWEIGKGKIIRLPYRDDTFDSIGLARDFFAVDPSGLYAKNIVYVHRQDESADIYFVSNQQDQSGTIRISLRVTGKQPEIWNPVTGEITDARNWEIKDGRTFLPLHLDAGESLFIVLRKPAGKTRVNTGDNWLTFSEEKNINGPWSVQFDPESRGPERPVIFNELTDWSKHPEERIRFYSGTAVYTNNFQWQKDPDNLTKIFIELENPANIAEIKVNGIPCGIAWTKPYRVEVTGALKSGKNAIEIAVTNTWANRIMGDEDFPTMSSGDPGKTWTNAPYRLKDKALIESGLIGKVRLLAGK